MTTKTKGLAKQLTDNWVQLVPYIMFLVIIVITVALNPSTLSVRWAANKMDSSLTLILVAIGQTIVLLTGGFDLSVGGVICITNCFSALYLGDSPGSMLICIVASIAMGVGVGLFNGLIIVKTGVQPFIVTLASQSVCYGIALLILKVDGGDVPAAYIQGLMQRIGVIPMSMFILAALILLWLWVKRTKFGLSLYAVGSNDKAARLNGIAVDKVKVMAYVTSGLFAALAGLFRTAQVASGSPTGGYSFVMISIAAAVIGGTALSGGVGGIIGTIVGAFVLRNITDLLVFLQISSYWTSFAQGLLLIVAVALSAYGKKRKELG